LLVPRLGGWVERGPRVRPLSVVIACIRAFVIDCARVSGSIVFRVTSRERDEGGSFVRWNRVATRCLPRGAFALTGRLFLLVPGPGLGRDTLTTIRFTDVLVTGEQDHTHSPHARSRIVLFRSRRSPRWAV
jgi:hypothetical protein